ncbi:hypothetical protein Taro_041304 [Colocasia esculenta]|uniref:Uncharacterized protein n=1 Tax=Colocasia esculenta TaxID=4460 RepID=A0A843WPF9_COLES|nr:hypothetical protein [Colocasia esculenta]
MACWPCACGGRRVCMGGYKRLQGPWPRAQGIESCDVGCGGAGHACMGLCMHGRFCEGLPCRGWLRRCCACSRWKGEHGDWALQEEKYLVHTLKVLQLSTDRLHLSTGTLVPEPRKPEPSVYVDRKNPICRQMTTIHLSTDTYSLSTTQGQIPEFGSEYTSSCRQPPYGYRHPPVYNTPDCCFGNPFLGVVRGGTGVCSSLTSWSVRGAGWFCLWALDLVEVCAEGCFRIVFDSASSTRVVFGPTLVVGCGVTLFCYFVVLCGRRFSLYYFLE